MEGVAGYFDADSVPGSNDLGAIVRDEEVFARSIVVCIGQPIGIVVADTEAAAQRAARAVKVAYQDLPAVLSIDEAIAAGSYFEACASRLPAPFPPLHILSITGFVHLEKTTVVRCAWMLLRGPFCLKAGSGIAVVVQQARRGTPRG